MEILCSPIQSMQPHVTKRKEGRGGQGEGGRGEGGGGERGGGEEEKYCLMLPQQAYLAFIPRTRLTHLSPETPSLRVITVNIPHFLDVFFRNIPCVYLYIKNHASEPFIFT